MKILKLLALVVVVSFGAYIFLVDPSQSSQKDNEDLERWKKHATKALKSAMGWQALVNKVDKQDVIDAPNIVKELVENISDIERVQKERQLPALSPAYLNAKPYIDGSKSLRVSGYDVLEFALNNNDIELAEKVFEGLNSKSPAYYAAAKVGLFHASYTSCSNAQKYLDILDPLKQEKDFFINHTKRPKSGTFSFAKRIIRIWAQVTMVCEGFEEALNILVRHHPMRITNDQYLLETYVDFAIALRMAGYKEDADRFIKVAEDLLTKGIFPHAPNGKGYILYYSLIFEKPEVPYNEYMEYRREFKKENPDSKLTLINLSYLMADKFALEGDYSKAFEAMKHDKITHKPGLNLIIEHARKNLKKEEQIEFFKSVAAKLQNEKPFNNYFLYEPLLQIALYLKELGEAQESNKLVMAAHGYLDSGEQSQKDKYFKQRANEMLGKYLMYMGHVEKGKELIMRFPEIRKTAHYKTIGAMYGHYVNERNVAAIQELKGKLDSYGVLTPHAAIEYLIYKDNWKEAERLANELKEDRKVGQYKTFFKRKMGLSRHNTFHIHRLEEFQFRETLIIKHKLCRLYNHCK